MFDSYYFSANSIAVLEEPRANDCASSVQYIGAVTASKFPVCDTLEGTMSTPGHWDGLYHRQIGLLQINYYDIDPHMGRKLVSTNAYIPSQRHYDMSVVPVYDDYRVLFDKFNKFNKRLCHYTWPYKTVGSDVLGNRGSQCNFAISCCCRMYLMRGLISQH